MAAALARVHRLDGTGLRDAPAHPPGGDTDVAVRAQREWDHLDRSETVLTHYDFWCGNALWDAAQATSVIESWAPNYHGIGRIDLTAQVLRQGMDAWAATL